MIDLTIDNVSKQIFYKDNLSISVSVLLGNEDTNNKKISCLSVYNKESNFSNITNVNKVSINTKEYLSISYKSKEKFEGVSFSVREYFLVYEFFKDISLVIKNKEKYLTKNKIDKEKISAVKVYNEKGKGLAFIPYLQEKDFGVLLFINSKKNKVFLNRTEANSLLMLLRNLNLVELGMSMLSLVSSENLELTRSITKGNKIRTRGDSNE
jgi:hypothetical protein